MLAVWPPLDFQRTPVTLILAALISVLALLALLDHQRYASYVEEWQLIIGPLLWTGALWQPLTTTLPHGGIIHAAFNLYWLLLIGGTVENAWGPWRMLLLVVALAYGSSMAQWVLPAYFGTVAPGIGLSGVGYGLFGLVWVGRRHRDDFALACSSGVVQLFVGWFFLCIVFTWLGWMRIGNVAHGAGLVLGALLGLTLYDRRKRLLWASLLGLCGLLTLTTLVWCPGHPAFELVRDHGQWWVARVFGVR